MVKMTYSVPIVGRQLHELVGQSDTSTEDGGTFDKIHHRSAQASDREHS